MIRFDVAPLVTPWRRHVPATPLARMPAKRPPLRVAGAADDDTPGCGWYVSSLDLAQGLELTEVEWIDADLPPHLAAALRFV